jgi:hypothetical protein
MKIIRGYKLFISFFTAIVFLMPLNFAGFMLLNEPILVLSFLGSLFCIVLYRNRLNRKHLLVFGLSFIISSSFYCILLIYMPLNFVIKDFFEVFKPLIYGFIFISGMLISEYLDEEKIINYILASVVFLVVFSSLVFFPQTYPFLDLYKGRTSDAAYNFHFFRFSGSLGYPGGFGYWLVLGIQVTMLAYYKSMLSSKKFMLLYGLGLLGLVFSGARGAVIIFVLSSLLFFLSTPTKRKTFFFSILFILLLISFLAFLFSGQSDIQAIAHFQKLLENAGGGTFGHRASELERLFEALSDGRLLGAGPNNYFIKSTYGPVESAYYFYGYKFGLVGLLAYGFLIYTFLVMGVKLFFYRFTLNLPFIVSCWALLNLVVAGVSNSITEEYKSFYMFFLLSGIVYKQYIDKFEPQFNKKKH